MTIKGRKESIESIEKRKKSLKEFFKNNPNHNVGRYKRTNKWKNKKSKEVKKWIEINGHNMKGRNHSKESIIKISKSLIGNKCAFINGISIDKF